MRGENIEEHKRVEEERDDIKIVEGREGMRERERNGERKRERSEGNVGTVS